MVHLAVSLLHGVGESLVAFCTELSSDKDIEFDTSTLSITRRVAKLLLPDRTPQPRKKLPIATPVPGLVQHAHSRWPRRPKLRHVTVKTRDRYRENARSLRAPVARRLHDRPPLAPRVIRSSSNCSKVSPITSSMPCSASRASFEG